MRRRVRLWVLTCGLIGAGLVLAVSGARPRPAPLAVMYLRYARQAEQNRTGLYTHEAALTWQALDSRTARKVTVLPGSSSGDLGFLPSPDGRWVLQWAGNTVDKEGWRLIAWQAVRTRDGELTDLSPARFFSADFLPYWRDADRVALERLRTRAVFDPQTGKLSGELREPKEDDDLLGEAQRALVAYGRGHCGKELKVVSAAYPRVAKAMGFDTYARRNPQEPREFLFLRTLGIPHLEVLSGYSASSPRGAFQSPSAAPSPDGSRIACAYLYNLQPVTGMQGFYHADGRLTVFDVRAGRKLWETTLASRPWNSHGQMFWTAMPPPYSEPEFSDLRWSADGRYLVFTAQGEEGGAEVSVRVMDTRTWKQVLRVPDASDAFFTPVPQ